MESNCNFLRLIWRILRGRRQHEEVCRRGDSGLLEHAALMRNVPDVTIARVNLVACRGNRNLMSLRVGDRVFAAPDMPFTPRGYDRQIGSECSVSELEADLIVTLSSATMGERIRSHLTSDLNLPARNEGTAHRGAEEVLSTINCSGSEGGPDEILDKFPPEILDVALVGPRSNSFGPHTLQLLALAYIRRDADHLGAVTLLEPRDDDRCIEPTGVGEGNCANHGRLNKYSECLNLQSFGPPTSTSIRAPQPWLGGAASPDHGPQPSGRLSVWYRHRRRCPGCRTSPRRRGRQRSAERLREPCAEQAFH